MAELVGARKRAFKDSIYRVVAERAALLADARRLELLDLLAQRPRDSPGLAKELECDEEAVEAALAPLVAAKIVAKKENCEVPRYRLADSAALDAFLALRRAGAKSVPGRRVLAEYLGDRDALDPDGVGRLLERVGRGEVILLDVRPVEEYEAGHLAGARSAPIEDIDRIGATLPKDVDVVAYCRGPFCCWSDAAASRLDKLGIKARALEDGVLDMRRPAAP